MIMIRFEIVVFFSLFTGVATDHWKCPLKHSSSSSHSSKYQYCKNCCPGKHDCRVYTFAFTQIKPRSMIQDGAVVGSRVELMKQVCCLAGKQCEAAAVPYVDCYDNSLDKSEVLNNRWFDVCIDLAVTDSQTVSYRSSKVPFFAIPSITGYINPASGLTLANFTEIGHNLSVAFVKNYAVPDGSVIQKYRDLGLFVKDEFIMPVDIGLGLLNQESQATIDMVENGDADLGLVIGVLADTSNVEVLFQLDNLNVGNVGTLVRKDERCLMEWWDRYLLKFVCSDHYIPYCNDMVDQFGPPITVHCLSNATRALWCD